MEKLKGKIKIMIREVKDFDINKNRKITQF